MFARVVIAVLLLSLISGCSGSFFAFSSGGVGQQFSITRVTPGSVVLGSGVTVIFVFFDGFVDRNAVVFFNGRPLPTIFHPNPPFSPFSNWSCFNFGCMVFPPFGTTGFFEARFSRDDMSVAATGEVRLQTSSEVSNSLPFTLLDTAPAPAVGSLSPAAAVAGGAEFELTVSGSGFLPDSVVTWNGSSRPTAYVSETQLVARIFDGDLASAGAAQVAVLNPGGGGGSGAVGFSIRP
ncbi:MAG TPA: IPT/TIG domain-containing protein [Clostridia bacterium]|nr:IPT/TIG domain-containing protein [Clostridia bacterium]